ncbi:class I tRNA ligase family protein, partial [bacterium]|nr:class I tRNA ligase family protein [bacterium]
MKDEIYCGESNSLRKKQIQTIVYTILKNLLISLAPIIPHTTDEAYQLLPFKKYLSVHLEDWIELQNNDLLTTDEKENFKNFFMLKDNVYNALELARQSDTIKKS